MRASSVLPDQDGDQEPVASRPLVTRQRLAEIERVLARRDARRRQERKDQPVRLRALLDEGGR